MPTGMQTDYLDVLCVNLSQPEICRKVPLIRPYDSEPSPTVRMVCKRNKCAKPKSQSVSGMSDSGKDTYDMSTMTSD